MKIVLALPLLLLSSCLNSDPVPTFTLPAISQTGANTMGFRVDGRTWQNFGRRCTFYGCHDNQLSAYYSSRSGQFQLSAGLNSKEYDEYFGIELRELNGAGTYLSGRAANRFSSPENSLYFVNSKQESYHSAGVAATKVIITRFDTINHIISGTFDGLLRADNDSVTTIGITDGRFDITY